MIGDTRRARRTHTMRVTVSTVFRPHASPPAAPGPEPRTTTHNASQGRRRLTAPCGEVAGALARRFSREVEVAGARHFSREVEVAIPPARFFSRGVQEQGLCH